MNPINILIIGRNPEVANVLLRLVNNNKNWKGKLAMTNDEAVTYFRESKFDIILLSSGIENDDETFLRKEFEKDPDVIIIQHYGGGSGLLSNEINAALNANKKSS